MYLACHMLVPTQSKTFLHITGLNGMSGLATMSLAITNTHVIFIPHGCLSWQYTVPAI